MKTLVLLFLTIPVISLGQGVSIDFENNDLTDWIQNSDSRWEISGEEAIRGSGSLHHVFDNDEAATDWIAYFHKPLKLDSAETTWEFTIKYKFNPSANNNWAVFIAANDLPDLNEYVGNALIVGVNYTGNNDEIGIWKQIGEIKECLLSTGFNWEENVGPGSPVRFRVRRSAENIKIEIDTSGSGYFLIGEAFENQIVRSDLFLLVYKYSSSYDRGLWLDDLTINGQFLIDNTGPAIEEVIPITAGKILIQFNEIVQLSNPNFCIDGIGCGIPVNSLGKSFDIVLPNNLYPGKKYVLQSPAVIDMHGNPTNAIGLFKEFYFPAAYDVVINEIMADPSPPVLLPEAEYIELMNACDENITMHNWKIKVNNRLVTLPIIKLMPGNFILVCDDEKAYEFDVENYNVIGLETFPSLNNDEAQIILTDYAGRLIHSVNYSSSWFNDKYKEEGGWSLELINPQDPCKTEGNWMESVNYKGGTPAQKNSVYSAKKLPDIPKLLRAATIGSDSLVLTFSEPMDSITITSSVFFNVDNGIGEPIAVIPKWPVADKVILTFSNQFQTCTEYSITLTSDFCTCAGIPVDPGQNARFRLPEEADSGDIVINEVLFDPDEEYEEFIELYNRSSKTIELQKFKLKTTNSNEALTITSEQFQLMSGGYCIISKSSSGNFSEEKFSFPERLINMGNMPVLLNDGSEIILYDSTGNKMDAACYSSDFHHPILSDTKGVSLERIDPEKSASDAGNWQSAASDAGYMTPAGPNSQYMPNASKNSLSLSSDIITPNGDGIYDELEICYSIDEPGYMCRLMVFDSKGIRITILANGSLLGIDGCFDYDGKDENGSKLSTGYYIIYFEAYNEKGKRFIEKKAFVISGG